MQKLLEFSLIPVGLANVDRKNSGQGGLGYPLLSNISSGYGVVDGILLRVTFIIDPNGVVRQYSINDLPVGRSVDEVLRLIKSFQFVDKYGEVSPAKWNPVSNPDTIKLDI